MNEFQIISKLGEGAYSVVYKVRRLIDGNIYALKKVKLANLSEKEKQNALNEVRILASVKSPYVISYKEAFFDENESSLGIVMEFADKGDLYQKITEFKKACVNFEEKDIWRIFIQMVKGLKSLHELKILHRDLKSANVFLFNDGSAKMGDLNVSKVARRGLGYTQTGTPYYASPEVWKDQPYDSKSDIWSLGCVLYEMITLKPPFRAENMEGLYNKVIKGQYQKVSDKYSSDLAEIIRLLLQVQPENRPSCDQLLKHPIVVKRVEFFKSYDVEEEIDNNLLQTIRIPKNLLFLTDRLPQANYERLPPVKKTLSMTKNPEMPELSKIKIKKPKKENKDEHQQIESKTKDSIVTIEGKKTKKTTEMKSLDLNIRSESQDLPTETPKKQKQQPQLPNINKASESPRRVIEKENYEYNNNKRTKEKSNYINPNNQKSHKYMPYVNNEHISNVYKIYAPYLKNYNIPKNKYSDRNYLKNIEKYYDYQNIYRPKKSSIDSSMIQGSGYNKIIPNRKLSPLKKNLIKI